MKSILSFLFIVIVASVTTAQTKLYSNGGKNTIQVASINSSISSNERAHVNQFSGIPLGLAGVAASAIVPRVLDGISTLIYNPKKYIKEYGDNMSFISSSAEHLQSYSDIYYKRSFTRDGVPELISSFHFAIDSLSGALQYTRLTLKDYEFRFSEAKLKSNAPAVNISLTLTIVYFIENEKKSLALAPFLISNHNPQGEATENKTIDEPTYQLIPPMDFIERFEVKVSEVNSKKKHWDTYLEAVYKENKDGISEVFINLVPDEE